MFWEGALFSIRNSLKSDERFQELMDLLLNFIAVSRSIKPSNLGLFSEPCHLTLGIPSGITLDYTNRFVFRHTGIDGLNHMSVSDCLEGLCARRYAAFQQPANFFHKPG